MSDVNRQRPRNDETDSEEQRNGSLIFESPDNKYLSDVPIYNLITDLQESTHDLNTEKSSTDGNKRNEIKTDDLKENQDPSLN